MERPYEKYTEEELVQIYINQQDSLIDIQEKRIKLQERKIEVQEKAITSLRIQLIITLLALGSILTLLIDKW